MTILHTIAMLCLLSGGQQSPRESAIRQHHCQKWYIQCLDKNRSERGIVYDLKQCILKR